MPPSPWIKCTTIAPPLNTRVLVYDATLGAQYVMLFAEKVDWPYLGLDDVNRDITHWQPLGPNP